MRPGLAELVQTEMADHSGYVYPRARQDPTEDSLSPDATRTELVTRVPTRAIREIIRRSTRHTRSLDRHRLAAYACNSRVHDVFGGALSITDIVQIGVPVGGAPLRSNICSREIFVITARDLRRGVATSAVRHEQVHSAATGGCVAGASSQTRRWTGPTISWKVVVLVREFHDARFDALGQDLAAVFGGD